jgi:hypothetical protein
MQWLDEVHFKWQKVAVIVSSDKRSCGGFKSLHHRFEQWGSHVGLETPPSVFRMTERVMVGSKMTLSAF